jgi:hypothetical protein
LGILGIENRKPKLFFFFSSQQQLPKKLSLFYFILSFQASASARIADYIRKGGGGGTGNGGRGTGRDGRGKGGEGMSASA